MVYWAIFYDSSFDREIECLCCLSYTSTFKLHLVNNACFLPLQCCYVWSPSHCQVTEIQGKWNIQFFVQRLLCVQVCELDCPKLMMFWIDHQSIRNGVMHSTNFSILALSGQDLDLEHNYEYTITDETCKISGLIWVTWLFERLEWISIRFFQIIFCKSSYFVSPDSGFWGWDSWSFGSNPSDNCGSPLSSRNCSCHDQRTAEHGCQTHSAGQWPSHRTACSCQEQSISCGCWHCALSARGMISNMELLVFASQRYHESKRRTKDLEGQTHLQHNGGHTRLSLKHSRHSFLPGLLILFATYKLFQDYVHCRS